MNLESKHCRDGLSFLWNQFIGTLLENMMLVVWNHPTACHLQIQKLIMTESSGHYFSLCGLLNVHLAYQIDLPSLTACWLNCKIQYAKKEQAFFYISSVNIKQQCFPYILFISAIITFGPRKWDRR